MRIAAKEESKPTLNATASTAPGTLRQEILLGAERDAA